MSQYVIDDVNRKLVGSIISRVVLLVQVLGNGQGAPGAAWSPCPQKQQAHVSKTVYILLSLISEQNIPIFTFS